MGVLVLLGFGCSLPGPAISGSWSAPGVAISNVASSPFEGGEILVYFFVVSQEAELKEPRVVNRGGAWERTITDAHHRIAEGWEVYLLPDNGNTPILLPISDHVTHMFVDGDELFLKSTWSFYSEEGMWMIDLQTMKTTEVLEEMSGDLANRFKEVSPDVNRDPVAEVPRLRERLLKTAEGKQR